MRTDAELSKIFDETVSRSDAELSKIWESKISGEGQTPVQLEEQPSGGLFGLLGKFGVKEKQYITPSPTGPMKTEPGLEPPGILGTLLNPADLLQNLLTGGAIGAMKAGRPIAQEMKSWATYNIPALAKSLYKGGASIIPGLAAKNVEQTIPVEKATPMAAEVAGSWLNKILPGAAKATTPEMQGIIDLAKRENVSILAPDITGNRAQALIFNAADKAIGGAGVTQKAASQTIKDMNAYGQRLLTGLGGEFDKTILGDVAREGMRVKFQPVQEHGDRLYDIAAREASGTPTQLINTTKIVDQIRNSKDFQYLPGPIKSVLNKVFSDISPVSKVTGGTRYGGLPEDILAKLQGQGLVQTMDFSDIESIRRAVSKLSFYKEISGDQGNRIAAQVLEAIEKDMDVAAAKAGTLAKAALDDARGWQKEQIFGVFKGRTELGKPSVGSRISTIPNEDFLKIISRGNITELQDIQKVLPGSTLQNVKQAWLTDLFSRHQRLLQTPSGKEFMIDTPGVGAELNKYGDKYLQTLFNPSEFKTIQTFRELAQHVGFAEKIASNPSGTAQTIYTIQLITGAGLAGYGAWKNDPISSATGLLFTFGGPYAIAKFMTSPAGFRYMTTGIKESPLIRDIISQGIKSAAIAGTHATTNMNALQPSVPETYQGSRIQMQP